MPPGRHRVRLVYRPASLRLGASVSAATVFTVGIALALRRRAGRS